MFKYVKAIFTRRPRFVVRTFNRTRAGKNKNTTVHIYGFVFGSFMIAFHKLDL